MSENIRELRRSGHPEKQSVAIAYKEAGKDSESKRQYDENGWYEIKGNPISKVGIFPYLGSQISPDLIPDKIYQVYRPEEELTTSETINSFKLIPWIDDHAMLGSSEEGLLPADKKGVHGVIGEEVYFEYPYLKGNLKIFSENLDEKISYNKKELSIGYRCDYDVVSGYSNGIKYDAIQRHIRGNHIALVDEGRSGPDVAVLDTAIFTFDTMEIINMHLEDKEMKNEELEIREDEMVKDSPEDMLRVIQEQLAAMHERIDLLESRGRDEVVEIEENPMDMESHEKDMKDNELNKELEKEAHEIHDEKKTEGMDSSLFKRFKKEASACDKLANRLSHHIGTFDHSDKTLQDIAKYGADKLGLRVAHGHELPAVEGYLIAAAKNKNNSGSAQTMDMYPQAARPTKIDKYLRGEI